MPAILIILTIHIIIAVLWMLIKILSAVINGQRSHKVTIPGGCCRALGLSVSIRWTNGNTGADILRGCLNLFVVSHYNTPCYKRISSFLTIL